MLPTSSLPDWVKDGFSGLVNEKGHIYLRAANAHKDSRGPAMVVSSVPLDKKFLGKIASKIGSLILDTQLSGDGKSLEKAVSDAQSGSAPPGFRPDQRRHSI